MAKSKRNAKTIAPRSKTFSKPKKNALPGYKLNMKRSERWALLDSIIDIQGYDHVFDAFRRLYPLQYKRISFIQDFERLKKSLPVKDCSIGREFSRKSNSCIKSKSKSKLSKKSKKKFSKKKVTFQ